MKAVRTTCLYTAATLLLLGTGGLQSQASAATCDVPLIVQQGSVPPNVLIIMDDSGSMNEAMFSDAYDPGTAYAGKFSSSTMYYVSSTGTYSPSSFNSRWPSTPTATLVSGVNGQAGRYIGNYLNWIYFNATDAQRATIPQVTRFHVGRAAVQAVVSQAVGLRYALMGFNYDNGGKLYVAPGTDTANFISKLNSMSPSSWTPSAETMVTAMNYFKSTGSSAWIQYPCQENFIIFVTDGYPTMDLNFPTSIGDADHDGLDPGNCDSIGATDYPASNDCSHWLDDAAYYLAHTDVRPDLDGDQFVYTYTIGFGLDAPLVRKAALEGEGLYSVAWDFGTLVQSLGTVVGDIVQRISSGAAVAVVSTEQGDGNQLFRGKFMPGQWRGYLEAYTLPYHQGDTPVWEAGSLLRARAYTERTIYTLADDGSTVPFIADNAFQLAGSMNLPAGVNAGDVINYVRGEDISYMRDRNHWKLGDLVYSTPLVVGPPSNYFLTTAYQQFLQQYQSRKPTVYVGANDGMLHAFDSSSGRELWAYVPRGVFANLAALTTPDYCHMSYVDLSPSAFDVQVNGVWRTVLVGGLRGGGNSYFAIDVTDAANPQILWETPVTQITTSFTEPAIVRKADATYLWTGSGPNPMGTATLAVLNMANGQLIALGQSSSKSGVNMCSGATVFDADWDDESDYVYQADLAGNMFRFDVRSENPWDWYGEYVYLGDQPIQTRPKLAVGTDGKAYVYFGTGQYVQASDLSSTAQQSFICVKDDGTVTSLSKSNLADQTSTIHDVDNYAGWYFNLVQGDGERVTEPATVIAGVVYFTSFAPRGGSCSGGGQSWLYHVDYRDGSRVHHDGDNQDGTADRVEALGDGVASKPVINAAEGTVIVQTSDARLNMADLQEPIRWMTVNAWRERFEQVVGDPRTSTHTQTAGQ